MTDFILWALSQGAEFCAGYDAASMGERRDSTKNREWLRGYDKCLDDESRSETARYL